MVCIVYYVYLAIHSIYFSYARFVRNEDKAENVNVKKCNLKTAASIIECIKYTKTKGRKIIRWSFYQKLPLSSLLSFIHFNYAP
jgi:hypothetical protein